MKSDLDQLMTEREIDAAVVTGGVHNNPSMYYMVNGVHLTRAILVKRRGHAPVLIHAAMERDEAAESGLATLDMTQLDYVGLVEESKSRLEAMVKLYGKIFDQLEISGRVAFYGVGEQGASYALLRSLDETFVDLTITGEFENDIFAVARATKEVDEVARMRRVGQAASAVMREMLDFVRDHRVQRRTHAGLDADVLVKSDGTALTIGDVKRFGRSRLFIHELEDSEGMIFAIGRDAGVPHSRGRADDPICLGQSIVFDFFPCELGGGYFHDMTRTFCLGYAPPEVQKAYDDVRECFERVMEALKPNTPTLAYAELACDVFEAQGHNTQRTDRVKQEGYIHSLGHGVGLALHERPVLSSAPSSQDVLRPGSVFTIEPGLYYPDRGYGVRIEDTVYLDENGQFHSLSDFDKGLVVEM